MNVNKLVTAGAAVALTLSSPTNGMAADTSPVGSGKIKHVLLSSIDGMHAVDFYNCAHGIAGANSGEPYCPNILVSYAGFTAQTVSAETTTTRVAPTILKALGLNPAALQEVKAEGTPVLYEVEAQLTK
jgi:hypothetical protein